MREEACGYLAHRSALGALWLTGLLLTAQGPLAAAPAGHGHVIRAPAKVADVAFRFPSGEAPARYAPGIIAVADGNGFRIEDIIGPAGKPLPVRVALPPEGNDLFRVIMFRGIPEKVELTKGFALEEAWAVSPDDLDDLALVAPEGYSGRFSLNVIYVHGRGEARERRTISVRIGDAAAQAEASARGEASLSPEMEASMFAKSRKLLATGDVAGARLVFDFLARHGSARGAFALAQTYDPEFLESLSVRGGVRPDMTKAMKWYRKAARLGSEPASTRLSALRAGQ